MLVVLMAGLNNRVSAQYNDNDNDNDTEVKVDKGKGKDDGDQSKRLEVIQKSLEKKKGILLGDTVYYMGKPNCLFITEKKFLGSLVQGTCKALNGKEAFWINLKTNEYLPNNDPNKRFFEIVFVASNAKINYMGSQNALIRDIAKFNLFEDGVYNTNSERKFCTMTNSTTINTGCQPKACTCEAVIFKPSKATPQRNTSLATKSMPGLQRSSCDKKLSAMPSSKAKSITGAP